MKHIIRQFLAFAVLVALVTPVAAKKATISIEMNDVRVRSGERGEFYVVNVSIPEDIAANRLDTAVLEFAVEAIALAEEDSVVTPVVGVFPLNEEFRDGGLVDGQGATAVSVPPFQGAVPSARPVALGANRVLRMDITSIVRGWLKEPSSNHGLVIGSLTGPKVGAVTMEATIPGAETPIRITFFYDDGLGISARAR